MNEVPKLPELVVMLTHHDFTSESAEEIFEECKYSQAKYWGLKEKPLSQERMKKLYSRMKEYGKTTVLEVVAYTLEEGLDGARIAANCGCDILMGTKFYKEIADFCKIHNIKYMPFVGDIEGRPSVLKGSIRDIIEEAREVVRNGAFGVDLLGYRYVDEAKELIVNIINKTEAPVCVAGSIDGYERLDEMKEYQPWAFTIGSAFFENKFNDDFSGQINKVCDYINK